MKRHHGSGLVVVNNAPFEAGRETSVLVEPPTGLFLKELSALVGDVTVAQGVVRFGDVSSQNTCDLTSQRDLHVDAIQWRLGSRTERLFSYARALPWIARNVWRAKFLYVFLPGHLPMLFVLMAKLLRRPYGIYLRGELDEPWLRRALHSARFVLAANEQVERDSARHCPDTSLVAPMVQLTQDDIREPSPREGSVPRALFVGRIETPKGISELLHAVAQIQRSGQPLELDLVGWAPELDHFRAEATRLGLVGIRFHGVVSDRTHLLQIYADADFFVLPTHTEGFPRVLYEAMALGVPILTTFVGGIPALMQDGVNCLEIPVRDAQGLARALERALTNPALCESLAAGGTATIHRVLGSDRPSHAREVSTRLEALER